MDSSFQLNLMWPLKKLQEPYQQIIAIERYVCRESVVVVFTTETGYRWAVLTPFN